VAYEARAIANFILDYAEKRNYPITIMALLKIIFFGHGWNFARTRRPLIREPFEAWKNGPVVRIVWESFRDEAGRPITGRATRLNPVTQETSVVRYDLDAETASFLESIVETYADVHAFELSNMTHAKGSPWDRAWNAPGGKVRAGMLISNDEIEQYFIQSAKQHTNH
jgi:uncharacterized phage-associated protein